MLKSFRFLALVTVAVASFAIERPLGWQVSQRFTGVTYSERSDSTPRPIRMHVAQIDLQTPGIRFKVSPPGGDREVMRQSTLDFLSQERAQLAINGHFFLPFPSDDRTAWVIGLGASEGQVFSAFEISGADLCPDRLRAGTQHRPRESCVDRPLRIPRFPMADTCGRTSSSGMSSPVPRRSLPPAP